jgi:hypothetical protein
MISLDNVVQVFHLPVLHRLRADSLRLQLGYCLGQSWCLVGVDDPREPGYRVRPQGLGQETLRCGDITLWGQVKIQGMPTRGDGPIEVAPLSPDPDIGLVHPPGPGLPIRDLSVPPGLLVQLRSIFLDPAVDGAVIDRYAAFGHHFFQIAVAEPVAAVPPDRPQDDFTGK